MTSTSKRIILPSNTVRFCHTISVITNGRYIRPIQTEIRMTTFPINIRMFTFINTTHVGKDTVL